METPRNHPDPAELANASQRSIVRTYERIAPVYDLLDAAYERSWKARLRAELFTFAHGRMLDVGIGTGCNIPHYPPECEVVGIDASRRMLQRASRRARAHDRSIQLFEMSLLQLDFPDHAFDTVVATFVLLCLPERLQLPALRELRRVCKPSGAVLLLDYRLSDDPAMRLCMRGLSPWLRWAFAARYDPGTDRYLGAAGLHAVTRRSFMRGAVSLQVLKPGPAASRDAVAA